MAEDSSNKNLAGGSESDAGRTQNLSNAEASYKKKKRRRRPRRRPKAALDKAKKQVSDQLTDVKKDVIKKEEKSEPDIRIGRQEESPLPIEVGKLNEEEKKVQEQPDYTYQYQEPEKAPEGEITEIPLRAEEVGEEEEEVPEEPIGMEEPEMKEEEFEDAFDDGSKQPEKEPEPLPEEKKPWTEVVAAHTEETKEEYEKAEDMMAEEQLPSDAEVLKEKDSVIDKLGRVALHTGGILAGVFNVKVIFGILLVGAVIWGLIWGISNDFHKKLFGGAEPSTEIDDSTVSLDQELLNETGIWGATLFGGNNGSIDDLIPVQIRNADYFGRFMEPSVSGETGISAATYYGELKDEEAIINAFVEYIRNLEQVRNMYKIDVYAMLDRTDQRDAMLTQYLNDLKAARETSREVFDSIHLNIDDLTQSYNSLKADKSKFETDFFTSLEELQAEKSDVLLKSFVDASQKQTALKARVAALEQIAQYYETALIKLDKRISAVEKNHEALVQGIRVVEVPGSGIDLIIREDG